MTIKLLAIGKTDNKQLQQLIDDYTKRLGFYIKFELERIRDLKKVKNLKKIDKNFFYITKNFDCMKNTIVIFILFFLKEESIKKG